MNLDGVARIAVIGSPGSGKSYLATRLAELTALPLYRLDDLYWRPEWTRTPQTEWETVVNDLVREDRWIIDGNYAPTLPARVAAADLVIFVDRPVALCLLTVLRRIAGWCLGRRTGLPARVAAGTRRLPRPRDLRHFLGVVTSFRRRSRPQILALLGAPGAPERLRLGGRAAVHRFLGGVSC